MTLFLQAALIIIIFMFLIWALSVFIKNVSIVDIFWGLGFIIVDLVYFLMASEINTRKILTLILVTIWGLRLAIYLSIRNIGKVEDFRYQQFRKQFGPKRYWWFSFFQTFLLQGSLILLISLPLFAINTSSSSGILTFLDVVALLVWSIGFIFEAGGDYQLFKFKSNPKNKDKVLNKGFWKYTRHPNYFGDAMIWWAYAILSIASGGYWHIIGSLVMTLLIIKVSGVLLLEKTLKITKPAYKTYIESTNSFFPWFPKK